MYILQDLTRETFENMHSALAERIVFLYTNKFNKKNVS